jgi:hypothetical protein
MRLNLDGVDCKGDTAETRGLRCQDRLETQLHRFVPASTSIREELERDARFGFVNSMQRSFVRTKLTLEVAY